MFESILVVCTGNVCRSPIGERLLRQHLPDRHITSAGILGLEGYPADECAQDVARRHGISLDGHVARRLTRRLMQGSDLILGYGAGTSSLHCSHGTGKQGKSLLFGQWLEPQDIPDPYRKSREAFEYVFGLLGKASREWARRLGQKGIKH